MSRARAPLPRGSLPLRTLHLCVDMQRLFGPGAPWSTPWLPRVLPCVLRLARHRPQHTLFTRFMPPERPADAAGSWRLYFEHWRQVTRERVDPALLELLPELAQLVPPARVLDKPAYSPFHRTRLAALLQEEAVEALVVSGTETDVCVLAAVLGAVDLGLRVVVARDALCSSSDETHDALMSLYHRRFSHQIEAADTDVVIEHWSR